MSLSDVDSPSESKRCLKCKRTLTGLEDVPLCEPCEIDRLRYDLAAAQEENARLQSVVEAGRKVLTTCAAFLHPSAAYWDLERAAAALRQTIIEAGLVAPPATAVNDLRLDRSGPGACRNEWPKSESRGFAPTFPTWPCPKCGGEMHVAHMEPGGFGWQCCTKDGGGCKWFVLAGAPLGE